MEATSESGLHQPKHDKVELNRSTKKNSHNKENVMVTVKLNPQGQFTIPAILRKQLHWNNGEEMNLLPCTSKDAKGFIVRRIESFALLRVRFSSRACVIGVINDSFKEPGSGEFLSPVVISFLRLNAAQSRNNSCYWLDSKLLRRQ